MKTKITNIALKIISGLGACGCGCFLAEMLNKGFYAWELGLGLALGIAVAVLPHTSMVEEDE